MCGIAGIISLNGLWKFNLEEVISLSYNLKHRGPDDEGFAFFNSPNVNSQDEVLLSGGESTPTDVYNAPLPYSPKKNISHFQGRDISYRLALVHRRLSIIDTSPAGHQPMCTPDENYWIIFNGEIYNYPEIKNMLLLKGYKFQTQTDTEVLLNAYIEWGFDCVNQFNGMWSFVIYDRVKNIVFGSRDRTGVKPFYYTRNNEVFAFASELKALVKLPFVNKEINQKAAFDFLVFNRIERMEESFFKGIFELMPAHSFSIDLNNSDFKKWKYFSPDVNHTYENFNPGNFEIYSDEIKNLVISAIQFRLRSDVPVGSCLSGGIDSSSVVCVINDLLKKEGQMSGYAGSTNFKKAIGDRQKVFTSSFRDSSIDESNWAKIVVDKTNAQWHQTFPEKNKLLEELQTLVYCQEIPFISTSTYAQFCVMRLAKENGIKVLLDGQGGDELFGGYRFHYFGLWRELLAHLKLSELFKEIGFFHGAVPYFLKNFMKYNLLPQMPGFLLNSVYPVYFNEFKYLNPDFIGENKNQFNNNADVFASSLNQMLEKEYFTGPLKNLLKYEDRNSMHFSIEARTPFADDINLSQKLFSIPSQYKIHHGVSKALLRNSMKGILPDEIRNRRDKMGFVTPNNRWISGIKDEVRHYIEEDNSGIFNKQLFLKEYDTFFNPASEKENYRVFKFISFAIWKNVFGM